MSLFKQTTGALLWSETEELQTLSFHFPGLYDAAYIWTHCSRGLLGCALAHAEYRPANVYVLCLKSVTTYMYMWLYNLIYG